MNPHRRPLRVLTALALIATSAVALVVGPAGRADAARPFSTPTYTANLTGEMRVNGASLMTCTTSVNAACPNAQTFSAVGADNNNNNHTMQYLKLDTSAAATGMLNNSALDLTIPSDATVTFAGLYWQAFGPDAATSAAHPGNKFKLKVPGSASYQTLTATKYDVDSGSGIFAGYADVTAIVAAAGTGTQTWWGGDIPEKLGTGDYGGWSILVVYSSPSLSMRNISVYDGLVIQGTSGTNTISISGFLTPPSGTVKSEIAVIAGEGDYNTTGDALKFNGTNVSDALNPANNVFNSRFTDDGVALPRTGTTQINGFGYDSKRINTNGFLTNSQVATTLVTSSGGDAYYPQVIATQIDLYAPSFPSQTKTVVDLNGNNPAKPGDTLRYTLNIQNTGQDPAILTSVTDTVPAGTAYVPGSIRYTAGPNSVAPVRTDGSGDDSAEIVGSTITARIGAGANALTGGILDPTLPASSFQTLTFDVTVLASALGTTIDNRYTLGYTAQTINKPYSYNSNVASYPVIAATADLHITKSATPTTVVAGQNVSYVVSVVNNGPYAAQAVSVSDPPAAGVSFVSATPSQGTCTGSTCAMGSVANGQTVTVTYVVTASPSLSTATPLGNTATVTSTTGDPNPGDESVTISNPVTASTDLSLTKALVAGPTLTAGANATWSLKATNNGPSNATGVTISDPLPAGLTYVSATSTVGSCTGGATVSCTIGTLASGASATVTLVTAVGPALASGSTVTNAATVSSTTTDPTSSNNTASASGTVAVSSDVSITKAATTNPITAGQSATWTLVVTNNGPSTATGVTASDAAPAGVTWTSAVSTVGTCSTAAAASCSVGTLPPGASATITVTGAVASGAADGSTLANTATVASTSADANASNNSASTATLVRAVVAIAVTKTATPSPVVAGRPLTYTLTFTDNGPSDTTNARIVDTIPASTTFQGSPTTTAGTCSTAGATLTCLLGRVTAGSTVTVTVVVDVASTFTGSSLTNTATGSSDQASAVAASVTTTVGRQADLAIVKTGPPGAVTAGTSGTWTFTITNNGPSLADRYTVSDPLPAGLSVTSVSDPACTGTTTVTCSFGSLAAGASRSFTVTTSTPASLASGPLSNTASITAAAPSDPASSNDTSTSVMTIVRSADLSVTKTGAGPLVAGSPYTWTIGAANAGPSDAPSTTVTDSLPSGLAFVSAGSDPRCSATGQLVTCVLGTMVPGASTSLTVVTSTSASLTAGATVTNGAAISSTVSDPVAGNDNATASATVSTRADLVVTKTGPATVTPGRSATWTLTVTNSGPSDAQAVVVDDAAPAGVTWTSASASDPAMSCTTAIRCPLATLAAGATVTVTVTGTIAASFPAAKITNTATVAAVTADPVPGNNSSSATSTVTTEADLVVAKTAGTATVVAGTTATWTVTVTNNGPSTARSVSLAEGLPTGVTIYSLNPSVGSCGATSCDLGDLAAGATTTIGVTTVIPSDTADASTVTNTASASSTTADPTAANNTASADMIVATSADLSITKRNTSASVTAGTATTWTMTVVNAGPSTSMATTVRDPLPPGVTAVVATTPIGSCSIGATLDCALGALDPGQAVTIVLDATTAPSLAGGSTLVNTAAVSSPTSDPDPSNDSASASTPVERSANLHVTKTYTGPVLTAGASSPSWLVEVVNNGPSDADGVVLTDAVPGHLTNALATPTQGSCTGTAPLECALGNVPAGASASVTIVADLDGDQLGPLTNRADATTTDVDPDASDNTATTSTPVTTSADVAITKAAVGAFVAGTDAAYVLTVTNDGPSAARAVTVTDPLPAGITYVAATGTAVTCAASGQLVTCRLGDLAGGDSTAISLAVHVAASYTGSLVNAATVASTTPDPNAANNSSTAMAIATGSADLAVSKVADGAFVAGEDGSFTITVVNHGPSVATSVSLADVAPAGFTPTVATASRGTCDLAVVCDLGSLAVGERAEVRITGAIGADVLGPITNDATASSATPDPVTVDNTATAVAVVATQADLAITKRADTDPITPGAPAQWTIVVTNNGPSYARDIDVIDAALAGVAWTHAVSTVGTCTTGPSVSCTIGELPAGASATVTVQGDVASSVTDGSTLTNAATATTTTNDPVPANNDATAATDVVAVASIEVTKTASPDPVVAGTGLTYTLRLHNLGPSDTTGARMVDTVPTGTGFHGAPSTSEGTCATAGRDLECQFGTVAAGGTVTVTVPVDVAAGYVGTAIANTATGSSDQASAESATFVSTVSQQADLALTKTGPVGPVVAGTNGAFSFTVANRGPSTAFDVDLTDVLPAGLTAVAASEPACSVGATVICHYASIAPGASSSFTVTVAVDPRMEAGPVTNTAGVVAAITPDPTASNNIASGVMTVVRSADVSSTKTVNGSFTPGEPLSWTVTATNAGPSTATDSVVTDLVPSGFAFDAAGSDARCTAAGRLVTCELGILAPSAGAVLVIATTTDPSLPPASSWTNLAQYTTTTPDPDGANNVSYATSTASPVADVALVKRGPAEVVPGLPATWTVTVTDNGPSDALDVAVDDAAPSGVSWTRVTASDGSPCDLTARCVLPRLSAGTSVTVTLTGAVDELLVGATVENTARVSSPTADPDVSNNRSTASSALVAKADLVVTKTAGSPTMTAGRDGTWTIVVTNTGPSPATNVVVSDNVVFAAGSTAATATLGTCTGLVCTVGSLGVGATAVVTIVTAVPSDAAAGASLVNSASVSSDTVDTNPSSDAASATSTVVTEADLSVVKANPSPSVVAGAPTTWTVAVANDGPSDAQAVVVSDALPPGASPTSVTLPGGSCAIAGATITCTFPTLVAGSHVVATIVGALDPSQADGTILHNTATVSSATGDPNGANDRSTVSTPVVRSADLRLTKTYIGPALTAGASTAAWRIDVTNAGPSDASVVDVTDPMLANVAAVTASTTQGTCDVVVACALGVLPAGATASVTITGEVVASQLGNLDNVASVAAAETDPIAGDNTGSTSTPVATMADLAVTKAAVGTFTPGTDGSYTITVTNHGPSDAQAVVVTDVLPAGFTFASAIGSGATSAGCTTSSVPAPSGALRCELGTLAPDATTTVTVTGRIGADYGASLLSNTATVASTTPDPNGDDNVSTADAAVSASADLSISKVAIGSFVAGGPAAYTLTVTNAGPSDARNVVVSDPPPAGFTSSSASAVIEGTMAGSCDLTVLCTIGTLAAGTTVTVSIGGRLDPGYTATTITNTASVSSTTADADIANNSASDVSPVDAVADLSIAKTADAPFTAGSAASWSITVVNHGPSDAQGAVVIDALPPGFAVAPADLPSGCAIAGAVVTCTRASLAAGATASWTIAGLVDADVAPAVSMTNAASIASATADPDRRDNSASASSGTVATEADLVVSKVATGPFTAGMAASWTVTVTNRGPSLARAVLVEDPAPAASDPSSLVLAPSQGTCSGATCSLGDLPAGATATVAVGATIVASATGTVTNAAAASSATPDPDPAANVATTTTPLDTRADLGITKTATGPFIAGSSVTYTLSIVNRGPSDALAVAVADPPPAGFTPTSAVPSQGGCDLAVSCLLGTMTPGSSVTVTVAGTLAGGYPPTDIVNTATVTSPTPDPNQADNSARHTGAVEAIADLSLAKVAVGSFVAGRATGSWTLTATNAGPSDARSVVVSDTLPSGFSAAGASLPPGCVVVGQDLTCTIGVLDAGAQTSWAITGTVAAGYLPSSITNAASISSAATDQNPSDNVVSAAAAVMSSAALSVTKSLDTANPTAGQPVRWTITAHNAGPSDAQDVHLTDPLPLGAGFSSAIPEAGTCGATDGTIDCALGVLGVGQTVTVVVDATLAAAFGDGAQLGNTVAVTSPTPDSDVTDNEAAAIGGAAALADLSVTKVGATSAFTAGGAANWTVRVSNAGPSDAQNLVITDPLPAGVTLVNATPSTTGSCVPGPPLTCAFPTVAVGATVQVVIAAALDASYAGSTIANTAAVVAATADANLVDNAATAVTPVGDYADLSTVKTAGPAATAGRADDASFSIVVSNAGPSDARSVTLADALPRGFTVSSAIPDGGSCDLTITCQLGVLAPGATATVRVVGTIDAGYVPGALVNTATSRSATPDPDASNDVGSASLDVVRSADLAVAKVLTAPRRSGPAVAGGAVSWSITIANQGPSDAVVVVVTDVVPDAVAGVTAPGCAVAGRTVTCRLATLAAGATTSFVVSGTLDAAATDASVLANTASVASATSDPEPTNDAATVTTPVIARATIEVTKVAAAPVVDAGGSLRWTVTATNRGPSLARDVSIADALPAGVTATDVPAGCVLDGSTEHCDVGSLVVGASASITIAGSAPAGTYSNVATVRSGTDLLGVTASAPSTVEVRPRAHIRLTKAADRTQARVGDQITWTITATNDGPSDARDLLVTEHLPAGLRLIGARPSLGEWDASSTTWSVGMLANGSSATLAVVTTVTAPGDLRNSVTAASTTFAPGATAIAPAVAAVEVVGNLPSTGQDMVGLITLAIAFTAAGGLLLARRDRAVRG